MLLDKIAGVPNSSWVVREGFREMVALKLTSWMRRNHPQGLQAEEKGRVEMGKNVVCLRD